MNWIQKMIIKLVYGTPAKGERILDKTIGVKTTWPPSGWSPKQAI